MAITQAVCKSFRSEYLKGTHALETDTLKCALYTSSASLDADTTAYSSTNEVTGTGYTAGGVTLTNVAVTLDGTGVILDADDPVWTASTITARGALIYNSSKANRAILVLDFSADRSSDNGEFRVELPAADISNALYRIVPA